MKKNVKYVNLVVALIVVLGALLKRSIYEAYEGYQYYRFRKCICKYSGQVDRRIAYTCYKLAKPHLELNDQALLEKRLARLENYFQNPEKEFADPPSQKAFAGDSFSRWFSDLMSTLKRDESPGKEIMELRYARDHVFIVAHNYLLEERGEKMSDGTPYVIPKNDRLFDKARLRLAKKTVEESLARYE